MAQEAVGRKWALPASGIILSVCILLITWLLLPRLVKVRTSGSAWLIGICWLVLTVAFEFASGLAGGNTVAELLSAYNPLTGNLWLLVLATTLLSPVLTGGRFHASSSGGTGTGSNNRFRRSSWN